jgi:NitT/TauT family transport system substrate-binding protein
MGSNRAGLAASLLLMLCGLAGFFLAALLVACGSAAARPPAPAVPGTPVPSAAPGEPSPPAARQTLRAAYTAPSASQAPLWLGVEAGLFREQGLDVELTYISGSDKAVAALLAGETPVTLLAANTLVSAVAQGADLVYVAGGSAKLMFQLMVPPQITNAAQLRGQPVGATGRGSANDFALRYALRRLGLDPEHDVVLRAIAGGEPQMLAAMQSGVIFAGAFNPPNDYLAEQAGMHSLARLADWNVPYQVAGVAVRRAYLAEQRDTVRRFVRGYVASVERMKADSSFAQAVMRRYLQSENLQAIEWGYRAAVEALPSPPYPTEAALQPVIEGLAEVTPEVRQVSPAALLDTTLLDELTAGGRVGQQR